MTAVYTRFVVLLVVAVLFAGSVPTIGVATSATYSERTGSENPFSEISVTGTQATGDFVVGKFDNDDDSDLLVFDGSTERYYEQTSAGEYVERTGSANPFSDVESAFGTRGRSFVADVDGDGYDDIITYNTISGTFRYVAHNQSAGSYEAQTGTDNPFDGITASGNQQTVDAILGDFDGDGDPDLLAFDGSERYFENDGGTYVERTGSENPFAGISEPAFWTRATTLVRDFDGDGDVDIAWQNGTPSDWTYIENLDSGGYEVRSGENNPLTGVSASATGGSLAAIVDDFDGDDEIEVLANDSTVRYYDRNATGQYSQVTGSKNPFSDVSPAFGVFGTTVTTDLDADSDRDLLWYDNGSLRYVEYTGTVGVPDATTVSVDTHPTDSTAGDAIGGPPQANVTDKFGNPVDGVAVTVAEEGGYGFDRGTTTNTTTNGITTFDDLFINESATGYRLNFSISADDAGVDADANALSDPFEINAAAADSLRIIDAPESVDAGESFTLTINATDEFDNPAADQSLSNVEISSEFDSKVLGPTGITLNETGAYEVTISTDAVTSANDSHTLTATADGLTDDSVNITVNATTADSVSVATQPTESTAGEAIAGPPRVNVTDQFGNPVDGVTVEVSEEGGYSFDSGTTINTTTTNGLTTFEDLFINKSATDYQLNFSISASESGVDTDASTLTETFNVTAAATNGLRIIDAPESVDAGAEFNVTINATDEFGNPAADQSLSNVEISSEFDGTVLGPTGVTLNGTGAREVTVPADTVTTANASHTLTATADGLTDDRLDIGVNTTAADSVTVDTQPTATVANESIGGPPKVTVTDASANELAGVTVTAALNGSATLRGTTAVDTNDTGVAIFDDLRVQDAGRYNLTIAVDADSAVNATTDSFEITAATPSLINVDSHPTASTAGESIVGPPTANVTDAFGNPIAGENVIATINASASLGGSTEIETETGGTASFGDLTVTDPGSYELTFELTDDGSVRTTTNAFEVMSADGNSITVDTQPTETTAGKTIGGPPTLTVTDEFGNPVEGVDVLVTLNDTGLQGTTTVSTDSSGVAEFDALRIETAGDYRLTFAPDANSAVNVTTDAFAITAARADSVDAADSTATAGVEGTITVDLTDEFGNPVDGETITTTNADGLGDLTGSAVTNETGVAEFTFNESTSATYSPTFELETDGTINDTATVTVDPAPPETITATANDLTHTVSDDFTDDNALVATVTVTDAFDNRVPGVTVNVTDNSTDIAVYNGRSQSTDADGRIDFEIQSATAQSNVAVEFTEKSTDRQQSARIEGVNFEAAGLDARGSASSYTVSTGTNVTFRANDSTIPEGSNPNYEWTWDNGMTTRTGTGITNSTSFGLPGTINTTLTVTVANENATDEFAVIVEDRRDPEVRLTAPETVGVGSSFTLDASASTDNAEIADYEWAFGNGTTANGSALDQPTGNYSAPGEYTVELVVTDTSGNTDTNTTTVVAEGANASLLTIGRAFGDVGTNSTATQSVDIANDGTIALNVTDTTISGTDASAFSLLGDEEPRVRPDENRSLVVGFTPETTGTKTATLDITTANNTGPDSFEIDLRGEGVASDLVPNESAVSFGTVDIGTTVERNVTIDNDGSDAADLDTAEFSGSAAGQFSVVDSLPTISAGESANVTVAFDPEAVGDLRSTLSVGSTGGDATQVALDGTGEGPLLSVPTTNRSVGSTGSGTETSATATLRNYGSQPLNVTDLSLAGPDAGAFEIDTDPDSLVVAPGATESVDLTFVPETPGTYNASLVVAHNDSTTGDAAIGLSGRGIAADISVGRTTVDFGTTAVGSSEFQNVTLTNEDDSGANLTVDATTIVGENPEDFSVESPDRPFVIEPGDDRDLRLNFTAGGEGKRTAQLQLYSDAGNGRQTNIWLTNTRSYIIVQEISNPTVNVDGRNLDTGDSTTVNVSTPSTRESNVTVEEIGMEMKRDGDFEMNIINNESAFDNVFTAGGDTELVQYVGINHLDHAADSTFDNTSLAYQVDSDALPAGVDSDEVAINRYNETRGEYVELDTEFLEQRGSSLFYRVETPGFSEFAITATDSDDGSDDGGNPTPSGSGGQSEPVERVASDTDGAYDTRIEVDADPGEIVEVDGESAGTGETLSSVNTISVDSLSLNVETDRAFGLDVATYGSDLTPSFDAERLDGATETRLEDAAVGFESETGTVSAGYLDIEHDLAADELSGATVTFSVHRSYLDELGIEPDGVTLYRQTADGWTPLSTDRTGNTEGHHRYSATTPGFSVFAIGTGSLRFAVTEIAIAESAITTGETATVTATVDNRGHYPGEYTAELRAGGGMVDSQTVEIEGHTSATVKLDFEPATAGEYDLTFNEIDTGTLTVGETDNTETVDPDHDADRSQDQPFSWILLPLIAGSLMIILLWWRRR